MGAFLGLLGSALVLGLVGGPHCMAMCGVACAAVTGGATSELPERPEPRSHSTPIFLNADAQTARLSAGPTQREWVFQLGRLVGYGTLGALAASLVDGLGWLASHSPAWHPLWVFFHAGLLALGLALVILGRQPIWMSTLARRVWQGFPLKGRSHSGVLAIGLAWALMPCGLLYSALLLASLSGGAGQGAATMAVFALGGALALLAGPAIWQRLTRLSGLSRVSRDAGTRLAGVLLCVDGLFALWMDLSASPSVIC